MGKGGRSWRSDAQSLPSTRNITIKIRNHLYGGRPQIKSLQPLQGFVHEFLIQETSRLGENSLGCHCERSEAISFIIKSKKIGLPRPPHQVRGPRPDCRNRFFSNLLDSNFPLNRRFLRYFSRFWVHLHHLSGSWKRGKRKEWRRRKRPMNPGK